MGEEKFAQTALVNAVQGAMAVQTQPSSDLRVATPGGVFQVRWDDNASASALGQLAFFAEFLKVSGLFERWVKSCPLQAWVKGLRTWRAYGVLRSPSLNARPV